MEAARELTVRRRRRADKERARSGVQGTGAPIRLDAVPARFPSPGTHLVLSACNGGLTATHLPDEALSPATGFLLAGAGSVCAPLWPVDDAITPGFMASYHQHLAAGRSATDALAATQRDWQREPALSWASWTTTMLSGSPGT